MIQMWAGQSTWCSAKEGYLLQHAFLMALLNFVSLLGLRV